MRRMDKLIEGKDQRGYDEREEGRREEETSVKEEIQEKIDGLV